jgi:4'-phosphopantetheinyl transferase
LTEIRHINPHVSLGLLDLREFSEKNGIYVKRELERAGTRFLIENLLNDPTVKLSYNEHNKPYLDQRPEHISISHSHDKLAIIINTKEHTGVDIELVRDKVKHIQHKFLNADEQHFADNDIGKLITLWAAKEALYKIYGLREVEFSKHLRIENFKNGQIFGNIELENFKKRYELVTELIDNYRLVYVLHEV